MAKRTQYYRQWYLKNREHKLKKSKAWLKELKRELGVDGFKEWKKGENDKYREGKKNIKNGIHFKHNAVSR